MVDGSRIESPKVAGLAAWYAAGARHRVDGEALFYRDSGAPAGAGEVETVLLLHGFPTSSWDWRAVWGPLGARYRLIAPDFPGLGFSDKPVRTYTIGGQADAVGDLLAGLGVASVHVLAHDYGDTVAQELMARQSAGEAAPVHLRSVCLLNGGLFPEAHRPLRVQKALAGPAGHWLIHLLGKNQALRSLRSVFGPETQPSEGEMEDYWSLISRNGGLRVIPSLLHYLAERRERRERWAAALAGGIPVQLVAGMLDPVSGPDIVARFRELVPLGDVVEIDSVGHYPHCESPDAVVDAFLAFAARHAA
jgi:pimeloyl-ACP methyl ester carboxylesterase